MINTYIKNLIIILLSAFVLINSALAEKKLPHGIIHQDGRTAPALKLHNIDGESYDLTDSKGKWVFVHFWATWCGPCRKEIPIIQNIINTYKGSKLDIAIVNTAESEDTVFNFLGLIAPDINPLMDSNGLITEQWQPRGLPATYFVDPNGKIKYLALGGRPWDKTIYADFLNSLAR